MQRPTDHLAGLRRRLRRVGGRAAPIPPTGGVSASHARPSERINELIRVAPRPTIDGRLPDQPGAPDALGELGLWRCADGAGPLRGHLRGRGTAADHRRRGPRCRRQRRHCPRIAVSTPSRTSTTRARSWPSTTPRTATLPVGPRDVFVATFWTTAEMTVRFRRWQAATYGAAPRRFGYVVQDFEPAFYPWSAQSMLAAATYDNAASIAAIFNTDLLRDHFHGQGIRFGDEFTFEPQAFADPSACPRGDTARPIRQDPCLRATQEATERVPADRRGPPSVACRTSVGGSMVGGLGRRRRTDPWNSATG